jgi:phosphoglycolate phosphatase
MRCKRPPPRQEGIIAITHSPAHVLFDLDGTLTDSSTGIVRCFTHALDSLKVKAVDVLPRVCVGPPIAAAFQTLLQTQDMRIVERAIAAYRERYEAMGMFENALYSGIVPALRLLRQEGCRLRVVTTKPRAYAIRIVEHFGLDPFFDAVHGPDLDDRARDKASLVGEALSDAGTTRAVMVGDRAEDITSARAHGIAAVAARWGYGSVEELSAADPTDAADSIEDVVQWVRNWMRATQE